MKQCFTDYFQLNRLFFPWFTLFFAFLVTVFVGTDPLFGQGQSELEGMFCGTVSDPEDYKKAAFFGNNQLLVDNLIKEGFAIDKNYLDRLEDIQEISATRESMITSQIPLFHIPVKAWIYREDVDTGNITLAQLDQVIDRLNELFSGQSNIRFYLLCEIDEIINGDFANGGAEFYNDYINDNRVAGALNVHFVIQSAGWAGRAQFPSGNPNYACAVTTFLLTPEVIGEVLAHEVGHTLGLYHTHHPGRNNSHVKNEDCGNCYQESVSRTMTQGLACVSTIGQRKCEVNGDFLCDTPADPALFWRNRFPNELYVNNCNYVPAIGGTDNWGENWQPNVGNIMSYAPTACFDNFSPLQIGSMIGNIGGIGITPVNFTVTGNSQLCINQSATYTVNTLPGVNGYTWEVPQGYTILGGQGTNAVLVQKNVSAGGTIRVRPNCGAFEATFDVMNTSSVTIEGPNVVCPNVGYSYQVPFYENATYAWSVTNGTIVDGQGTRFPYIIFDGYVGSSLSVSISIPGCTSNIQGGMGVNRYPEQQCGSMRTEADGADEIEDLEEEEVSNKQNQESGAELTEVPQVNMRIFPNSATSSTLIECPDNILHYQLFIFNSVGENVFFNEKVQDKYELDITNLRNGIYVVYLVNEDKVYQEKLIVNK